MRTVGIILSRGSAFGGVYQYGLAMAQALSQSRANNYIIYTNDPTEEYADLQLPVIILPKRIPFFRLVVSLLARIIWPWSLGRFVNRKDFFSEADVLISPFPSECLYLTTKPFIMTIHDLQENYYPDFFTIKQRLGRKIRNQPLAKIAKKILCESGYVKNDIVKFLRVAEDKISVVPSPPPASATLNLDPNTLDNIRLRYRLPQKYILYPAQFWYHKNHLNLLDAFHLVRKVHPDLHLVLTGGKQNNYENVKQRITELNLSQFVHLPGYIDYADLQGIYKMSRMLVMPSLFESISIPVFEAFSLGVPVCASNIVAIPEQLGDAGLLFDPKDPSDIAHQICEILENSELSEILCNRGNRKISELTPIRYAQELEMLINIL